jgi:hypothetical protein
MQWRPGQLPLLADAIEDFYSPSASKGSCWRPRQLVADLLAKQAAGGHAPSAGKASCWRIFILHAMEGLLSIL